MGSPLAQYPTSVVASVCSLWEEVMLRVPDFWTYLVINLDADDFSPRRLGLRFSASRDRPIKVLITRTVVSYTECLKDIERSRMIQTITALRSHVHRCQSLQIKVVHSSLLPRLLAFLPSNMPLIQELILESQIDSGRLEIQPYSQINANRATAHLIDWGRLTTIVIDVWNFFEIYSFNPTPSQQFPSKSYWLSIKFGGDGFSANNITRLIEGCSLGRFEVNSVAFMAEMYLNKVHPLSQSY